MRLKQSVLAAVAAAGLMAGAAAAEEGGWHHMEGMEILHGLDLTAPQQNQVHAIVKSAWAQAAPIREKMRAVHDQMANQLLSTGTVTAAALSPMVQQAEALRAQLDQIHVNTMVQIRALLTAEQVSRAAELHAKLEALHAQEHALTGEEE